MFEDTSTKERVLLLNEYLSKVLLLFFNLVEKKEQIKLEELGRDRDFVFFIRKLVEI